GVATGGIAVHKQQGAPAAGQLVLNADAAARGLRHVPTVAGNPQRLDKPRRRPAGRVPEPGTAASPAFPAACRISFRHTGGLATLPLHLTSELLMSRRLLAAAFITVLVPLFGACGDDAGAGSTAPTNTPVGSQSQATNSSSTPKLSSPASQYALSIEDLGANWITDIPHTFVLDAAAYGSTKAFSTPADGLKSLTDWGYVDGYQTGYIPEGRDTAVLNGAYYIQTETHLFKDAAGAQKAFDYFSKYAHSAQGAQPGSIQAL